MGSGVVGREGVLDTIDALLSGAAEVSTMVLEGEAGIGKSTVLREAAQRAERAGFTVLSCAPSAAEARWSFAALGDLLGSIDDARLDTLPAPQRRALRVALLREESGSIRPARRAVATATSAVLADLAGQRPLALIIDDAQWLDVATVRTLDYAVRRLLGSPVIVLTAHRTDTRDSTAVGLFDGLPANSLVRIRLGPLGVPALRSLLLARLGRTLSGPQLRALAAIARGNPLHALELASLVDDSGGVASVPRDLHRLVTDRLSRVPLRTRRSLLCVAAAVKPTTAMLSSVDLEVAVAAELLSVDGGRVSFVHPLYASSIYRSASVAERNAVHRRLATSAPEPEERARHLALSSARPAETIAQTLVAASEQARTVGAIDAAAELAVLAVQRTPKRNADRRARRGVVAATHLVHAGDIQGALSIIEALLAELPRGRTRGEALRLLAEIRNYDDGYHEAVSLLHEALDQDDDDDFQVPTLLANAYAVFSAGDLASATGFAHRALERAERLGDGALIAEALAVVTAGTGFSGDSIDWAAFERAVELEDRSRALPIQMRPSVLAAEQMMYRGRLDAAVDSLIELKCWFTQRGEEGDLPYLLFFLALCRWWQGRYGESIDAAHHAVMISQQAGNNAMIGLGLAHRGRANAALGRLDEARDDLHLALELLEPTGWSWGIAVARAGSGWLAVTIGDPAAAVIELEPFADDPLHGSGIWMVTGVVLSDLVEALVQLGEIDRAARVIDSFVTNYPELDVAWVEVVVMRSRALVDAARGDLDRALELARRASAASASCEMPLEHARCLLVQGRLERRLRQRAAARHSLEQALAIFQEIGAVNWAQTASTDLARLGIAVPSGTLTTTEARIGRLAADGFTNREIAATLFISRRTVETNLARVYAKLGIRSRAQLYAALA